MRPHSWNTSAPAIQHSAMFPALRVTHWGRRLYETFFRSYTEKVWGHSAQRDQRRLGGSADQGPLDSDALFLEEETGAGQGPRNGPAAHRARPRTALERSIGRCGRPLTRPALSSAKVRNPTRALTAPSHLMESKPSGTHRGLQALLTCVDNPLTVLASELPIS